MSSWPALAALRLGCVQYLNAMPLIEGYGGRVVFDHPSALARELADGALDVALVPTFEALRGGPYLIADGVGIVSDGPVYSVYLTHRVPLSEVQTIVLDPASLTSVHLLKVLLAEYHGLRPRFLRAGHEGGREGPGGFLGFDEASEADATLLIGNQAIDFREDHGAGRQFLDLGEEWKKQTGLPFVYAPWVLRAGLEDPQAAAAELRALGRRGVAQIEQIVVRETFREEAFRRRYLTEHIRFTLGAREKAGMEKFRELLVKHGFLPPGGAPLSFV